MFAKFYVTLLTLATVAVALPTPGGVEQCNTGDAQCCNQVLDAQSANAAGLLGGLLGVDVSNLTGLVGLQCNPITVIGGVLGNCKATQQPVCCQGNSANGLVVVQCSPISL